MEELGLKEAMYQPLGMRAGMAHGERYLTTKMVETVTSNSAKPDYGYYALYIFAILSAVIIVTGILVANFEWSLPGT